jgi:transcriptional regulator with XRE-family HTH domain
MVCRTIVSTVLKSSLLNSAYMPRKILIKFGQKVRTERQKRGLSQEDLAEKAGVHRTYIGMIERGEKNITLLNIEKLAKALGIALDKLMSLEK